MIWSCESRSPLAAALLVKMQSTTLGLEGKLFVTPDTVKDDAMFAIAPPSPAAWLLLNVQWMIVGLLAKSKIPPPFAEAAPFQS